MTDEGPGTGAAPGGGGFVAPAGYRALAAAGAFEYGADRDEWARTWRERALTDPPALMCADEVEWLPVAEVGTWVAPDYWRAELGLVPFAGTGTGDLWCWYPAWVDAATGEPAVVLAPHDLNEAECFAPTFGGFLFRHLLEAAARTDQGSLDRDGFTVEQISLMLRANLAVVAPYLPSGAATFLEDLLQAPPREIRESHRTWEDHYWSLIDSAAVDAALVEFLPGPHLDEMFPHMR